MLLVLIHPNGQIQRFMPTIFVVLVALQLLDRLIAFG